MQTSEFKMFAVNIFDSLHMRKQNFASLKVKIHFVFFQTTKNKAIILRNGQKCLYFNSLKCYHITFQIGWSFFWLISLKKIKKLKIQICLQNIKYRINVVSVEATVKIKIFPIKSD